MRKVRYQVAMSLDGFIADHQDGYGWIPEEPGFDFSALFAQFDTVLMGRRTYEAVPAQLASLQGLQGLQVIVFSRSLNQAEHPGVRIVRTGPGDVIRELRSRPGRDIWLYGGGELFRSMLQAGLVDTVEPAVMPVLLGGGKRLLPEARGSWQLQLLNSTRYDTSAMVLLEYAVSQLRAPLK